MLRVFGSAWLIFFLCGVGQAEWGATLVATGQNGWGWLFIGACCLVYAALGVAWRRRHGMPLRRRVSAADHDPETA